MALQIKITQLPDIGNSIGGNTLLPVVNLSGTAITEKASLSNIANVILADAGLTLKPAFLANLAYSVVNAAQPNITSVGTLNINTLHISGGENGYVLQTDGLGNLNWSAMPGSGNAGPGGTNTQIQFNDSGLFNGTTVFTYNKDSSTLTVPNITVAEANILGNLFSANLNVSDTLTVENVVVNNFTTNSFTTTNDITANSFIGDGSLLTGITANATGSGPNMAVQYNIDGVFAGDGNFTYDPLGTLTVPNIVTDWMTVNNSISVTDISATGSISGATYITADYLLGDGSNITNIGNVSYAESANIANTANIANGVAVENVIGIGNISILSLDGNSSNILYGNGVFAPSAPSSNYGDSNVVSLLTAYGSNSITTTGDVSAGNIIGNGQFLTGISGANIVGTVEYATIANSVDVSNVSGIGNIAVLNLDGSSSNVLYGNGVFGPSAPITSSIISNGTSNVSIPSSNGNAVTSINGNAVLTVHSGGATVAGNISANVNGYAIGYRDIPQVSLGANTTLASSDAGKHYYSVSASNLVVTVANNSTVPFNIGAAINIVNQGTGNITILRGPGVTMYLAGNTTSSDRTLSSYGMATLLKVANDTWFISGTGVS